MRAKGIKSCCFLMLAAQLFLLCGCKERVLSPNAYIKYMTDSRHNATKQKNMDRLKYTVRYMTPEMMVLRELRHLSQVDVKLFDSLKNEYDGLCYFDMRVEPSEDGGHIYNALDKTKKEVANAEWYMSFDMGRDFMLVSGTDTVGSALYHFNSTTGLSKVYDYSLAFNRKKGSEQEDMVLVYEDKIFGDGLLKFYFSAAEIQSLPKLKL